MHVHHDNHHLDVNHTGFTISTHTSNYLFRPLFSRCVDDRSNSPTGMAEPVDLRHFRGF